MPTASTTATANVSSSQSRGTPLTWRPTKIMNMSDLSKDDDFLSHLLVEKLGTGAVPLLVHKMDPSRRLPKTNVEDLMLIVRRLVTSKLAPQNAIRQVVDDLLADNHFSLPSVRYYLKPYTQKQINAFATHASRYFELYNPAGCIEIAHTSRYSHRTGKSELCILATRQLAPGVVITELKGSMAHLSKEEDKELKRTDLRNIDIRRDFSVIHSRQMKKNHLFLGPARFVNHDCDNNCELFREGKYITFRTLRAIATGEEITAHYGDGYFGSKNRHCLCETCEKNGRGGYAPDHSEGGVGPGSEQDADASDDDAEERTAPVADVNERRTRRGVYAIVQEQDSDSDAESDDEEQEGNKPLANAPDAPGDDEVDLELGGEASHSLAVSSSSHHSVPTDVTVSTPDPDVNPSRMSSVTADGSASSNKGTAPAKSIVSTRKQKTAQELSSKHSTPVPHASHNQSSRLRRQSLRDSVSVTPSRSKGKETERVQVKEESEARVLRARPSVVADKSESAGPPKREIPRGEDGKPLPTCMTCSNVLPVISVDSKVVWGLHLDSPRRGKKSKQRQDCPRCMRHFAIYAHPWPARIQSQAVGIPARDEVEVSSSRARPPQKSVPTVERKRASSVDERPVKKPKTDQRPSVEMSAKAKELLVPPKRKRGRPRKYPLPEEELPKRKRGRPRKYPLPDGVPQPSSPPPKPPVTSPAPVIKPSAPSPQSVSKNDQSPSSRSNKSKVVAVQSQPRDSNGRFGKKATTNGRFVRKKFGVFRALTRTERLFYRHNKVKQWLAGRHEGDETEDEETDTADCDQSNDPETLPTGKRAASFPLEGCAPPTKKSRHLDSPFEGNGEALEYSLSAPSAISPYRFKGAGSSLLYHPNPTNYARRKWAPPYPDDVSHDEEDSGTSLPTLGSSTGPVTPDDHDQTSLSIAGPSQLEHTVAEKLAPCASWREPAHMPNSVLTFRPSPANFARRRWSSMSKTPLDSGSRTRRSVRLNPTTKGLGADVDGPYATPTVDSQSNVRISSVSQDMYIEGGAIPRAESYASFGDLGEQFLISDVHRRTSFPDEDTPDSNSDDDRAVEGLLSESKEAHAGVANEEQFSHLRVTYTAKLPAPVPWKNAHGTPMSHYLRKSASFAEETTSPIRFIDAGWESDYSD